MLGLYKGGLCVPPGRCGGWSFASCECLISRVHSLSILPYPPVCVPIVLVTSLSIHLLVLSLASNTSACSSSEIKICNSSCQHSLSQAYGSTCQPSQQLTAYTDSSQWNLLRLVCQLIGKKVRNCVICVCVCIPRSLFLSLRLARLLAETSPGAKEIKVFCGYDSYTRSADYFCVCDYVCLFVSCLSHFKVYNQNEKISTVTA